MEVGMWYMLWMSSLVFTICSFIWRKHVLFPLLAFAFWEATALSMQQIHYLGFGATTQITVTKEVGDWSGQIGIMYLLHGTGIMMALYALYNSLLMSKSEVEAVAEGRPLGWERITR